MAQPSLFPKFMNPLAGVSGGGGEGFEVILAIDPDIELSDNPDIEIGSDEIDIVLEPDFEIEVD